MKFPTLGGFFLQEFTYPLAHLASPSSSKGRRLEPYIWSELDHSDLILIRLFFLTFTTNFNSFILQDDKDELRRSPGTPVFTAPECILGGCFLFKLVRYYCFEVQVLTAVLCLDMFLGVKYGGKAADTWAVGVTLYCMILGEYPFLGDTLQDTYDKVRNTHSDIYDKVRKTCMFLL